MDHQQTGATGYRGLLHQEALNNQRQLLQNIAALKAMLDVLPDDTTCFSSETIDNYLWVIEGLLQEIYCQLSAHMDEDQ